MGFIYAAIAGAVMSIQGVFNTRLGEKIGMLESNALVQGTAFALSLLVMLFFGKGNPAAAGDVNRLYLTGGLLGVAITVTVMLSVSALSPATAVSTILIAQLLVAAIIDCFGLFGTEKAEFGWNKYLGLALLIAGIIVFKFRKNS